MNKNNVKTCPKGEELNPITKRCNKNCKDGEIRDEKFKCVKTKKGNFQIYLQKMMLNHVLTEKN